MCVGRWCGARNSHREQNAARTLDPGVRERQSGHRCRKPHGGHGGDYSLAWNLAEGLAVLRRCAFCNAVPYPTRKHIQVKTIFVLKLTMELDAQLIIINWKKIFRYVN